ncbi:MAG: hypothetical protein ACE5I1_11465, partial [bacterium]
MIANEAHVRSVGNLPTSLGDAVILPHLRTAKKRIRKLVGSSTYDTAQADAAAKSYDFTLTTEDTANLADAEAYFTLSLGIASWNTVMQQVGSTAAGITAEGAVGENTYRYLNPDAIKRLSDQWLQQAMELLEQFVSGDLSGTPGPGISYAYDDDGEVIRDAYLDE